MMQYGADRERVHRHARNDRRWCRCHGDRDVAVRLSASRSWCCGAGRGLGHDATRDVSAAVAPPACQRRELHLFCSAVADAVSLDAIPGAMALARPASSRKLSRTLTVLATPVPRSSCGGEGGRRARPNAGDPLIGPGVGLESSALAFAERASRGDGRSGR